MVAVDPVEMLQDRLGIDQAAAADLASIEISCPAPGRTERSSLGDFLSSDHGTEQGALAIVEDIAAEAQEGATHEEAIVRTLGKRAVVRDPDTGELARVTPLEPVESKKK